jgi:hypothetical protein
MARGDMAGGIAEAKLELRPADFNAEQWFFHGLRKIIPA